MENIELKAVAENTVERVKKASLKDYGITGLVGLGVFKLVELSIIGFTKVSTKISEIKNQKKLSNESNVVNEVTDNPTENEN